ncbi:hypothetical protein C8R44DRAFT_781962 [Mycena epipterygia]|nr:hypothetical protein C8R44DRAFT_781962 [Mycena epipterygia]
MSASGTTSHDISGYLRVASIAIAFYDYLQTLPFELRMCREQWRARHLTLSFALFYLIRYSSILVLTVSNVGFFSTHFTRASCQKYYLIPSVFKVLQAMVSQAILGVRAYNLSRNSALIGRALVVLYITSCTFEWVATMYDRKMEYSSIFGNCSSQSPSGLFGGWIHYAVAIIYDFITSVVSIVYLLKLKPSSASLMARVTKTMLVDGVWYFVALAFVNFLNLGFYRAKPLASQLEVQTAAASLGYCVTWIMAQKLIIHLHDMSVERRNQSIGAAVTVTQQIVSARDVSHAIRSQFESKNGMGLELTVPDFNFDSIPCTSPIHEDVDVQVRIERTVRMERLPHVYELEDYSRNARTTRRSKPS